MLAGTPEECLLEPGTLCQEVLLEVGVGGCCCCVDVDAVVIVIPLDGALVVNREMGIIE